MSTPASPQGEAFERAAGAGRSNLVMAPVLLLCGLAAVVVVARSLGPADYAIFAAAIAFRGLVGYIGDLGAGTAATRLFAQLHAQGAASQARRIYLRLVALRAPFVLALVVIVVFARDEVAKLSGLADSELGLIGLFGLIAAFEVTATLGTSTLLGLFQHRTVNRLTLASTLAQPVVIVGAVAAGAGVTGVVAGVVVGSAVRSLGANALALLVLRRAEDGGGHVDGVAASYARVAGSAVVGKLAAIIHQRQVLTFVGLSTFGRPEVAAFALAYDFALQTLNAIAGPVYSLLLPGLTAIKDDRARTQRSFALVTRMLALAVGVPAVALAILFAVLVPTVFGGAYQDAVPFGIVFLLLFALEVILSGPATSIMLADEALGRSFRRIKGLTIAAAVVYVPLLTWSLLAAAVAMMVIRVVSALGLHVAIARATGMRVGGPWIRPYALVLAATGAAAALPLAVGATGAGALVAGLVLAGAAALASVRATRALDSSDVDLVVRAVPAAGRVLRFLTV
ncbi:MAG: Polysaccharide biosynthesis protein [Solirubrobacteraceae bacterium]|nr:Polysaccharide biosynthesis protein [Solirubrobacteraceae bacterium]